MNNCPKCNENITTLTVDELVVIKYEFSENGEYEEIKREAYPYEQEVFFCCPNCEEEITDNKEIAEKFLNNKEKGRPKKKRKKLKN